LKQRNFAHWYYVDLMLAYKRSSANPYTLLYTHSAPNVCLSSSTSVSKTLLLRCLNVI